MNVNMKNLKHIALFILVSQIFPGCKDQLTNPQLFIDLRLSFISGSIGADLMPSVPPDPIGCQIVLLAENKNPTLTITSLSIPRADVFISSSNLKLGTIIFTTNWDGRLAPLEKDTVNLIKVISPVTIFDPPCNEYVYLRILIQDDSNNSITFKTDSLFFGCVY